MTDPSVGNLAVSNALMAFKADFLGDEDSQIDALIGAGSPGDRAASVDTGTPGGGFIVPSDSFTPSSAGAPGASSTIRRDSDAKVGRANPVVPLYWEGDCYAVIQMVSEQGSSSGGDGFENFLLQAVRRNHEERAQIFETFRLPIIYFTDEAPIVYTFSGSVPSGRTSDGLIWANEFQTFYQNSFRGTVAVQNQQVALIAYNTIVTLGYAMNLRMGDTSDDPALMTFSFDFFVLDSRIVGS